MTIAFDHREAGTAEARWRAAGLDQALAVVASEAQLVVLAAHPDDETLGAGGLIAASAELGAEIAVVVATDGEGSHPASPTHTAHRLRGIRRREVRAAVSRLAPRAAVHLIGLPDGALSRHDAELQAALSAVVGPGRVRLVSPWMGDRHPDHEACAAAAAQVARGRGTEVEHWQYPIWAWHWDDPADSALPRELVRRLELGERVRSAKRSALDLHASQHRPLSPAEGDEPILSAQMLTHFDRPYECFLVGPPPEARPAARPEYFDALYAGSDDPWGLTDRFYERRKRAILLGSLPRERFRRVFEPGCATGLLTAALAERADELVAWDVADRALEQAAERLGAVPGVRLERGAIPAQWPPGSFDLVVLSEVGYYCRDLGELVHRTLGSLADDGIVVGCHWTHPATDHPHSGAAVHEAFDRVLHRDAHHVERDFRLDVWSRAGTSVAVAEGIV